MEGKLLFAIPVYFRTLAANVEAVEKTKKRERAALEEGLRQMHEGWRAPLREGVMTNLEKYNVPWQYSQIVG